MSASRTIALVTAALALSACGQAGGGSGGHKLCTPFTTAANTATPAPGALAATSDPATAVDDCLHRWGYSLATSSDPAEAVANATVAACSSTLSQWNQQSLSSEQGVEEAPSMVTGQATTPFIEHHAYAQRRALFYVVQARAGKCAPPPATNGAPAGVPVR